MTDHAGFCSDCGAVAQLKIPAGDNRQRRVCSDCDTIHYENPKNVVGCLLHWQGKVLLCKRAIEPRYGYWTLPAGFMENGESTLEGAAREAFEESSARSDRLRLYCIYNLPRISQIYLMYIGELRDGYARANEETLEVGLFARAQIPWDELAFPVVTETLTRFYEDNDAGGNAQQHGGVHCADILSRPGAPLKIVRHE